MSNWVLNILGQIYKNVPEKLRPYLKKTFLWSVIRMKAIILLRNICLGKRIEFVDFETANLELCEFLGPGKKEVLIEVYCSAVSPGTESAVLCGLPGARRSFPYSPGYSVSGKILKEGAKVKDFKIGDRVAGRLQHMSQGILPSDRLFKVPDNVSFEEASMVELGIITLQGIRKAHIKPGDRVAVVGQGLIGQICNKLAKFLGAVEVIAVANSRSREKTALSGKGADRFVSLGEEVENIDTIRADIVIEAVGSPNAVVTASKCARDGGRVILLGSSRGLGRDVNWLQLFQLRNISMIGAHISAIPDRDASIGRWTYRQEGELFFDLLSSGRLRVSNLVTWRAKPEECNKVYEVLAEGGREHVGIVFCWKQDEC